MNENEQESAPTPEETPVSASDVVEVVEEVPAEVEMTEVDLKEDVRINGTLYAKGEKVKVPTEAFHVWRHAV